MTEIVSFNCENCGINVQYEYVGRGKKRIFCPKCTRKRDRKKPSKEVELAFELRPLEEMRRGLTSEERAALKKSVSKKRRANEIRAARIERSI